MNDREHAFIGLGSNLPTKFFGSPEGNLVAAIRELTALCGESLRCSPFYRSAPVPPSDQPDCINAVAQIRTKMGPELLMETLHEIEARFGRVRSQRNAARVLDLDLLAYGDRVTRPPRTPILPHPRLHRRAFVLRPMADLDAGWRHPRLGITVADMVRRLPARDDVKVLPEDR